MLLSALIGSIAGVIAGLRGGRHRAGDHALRRRADGLPRYSSGDPDGGRAGRQCAQPILVLGISRWMVYARIVFGLTRTLRQRPFVEAATLYGGGDGYIMRRHILRR